MSSPEVYIAHNEWLKQGMTEFRKGLTALGRKQGKRGVIHDQKCREISIYWKGRDAPIRVRSCDVFSKLKE